MFSRRKVILPAIALTAAAGLTLTACGPGDSGSTAPDESGGLETTEINVGVLAFADLAPFYIALDRGLFEDEGLTVKVSETASGVPQLPSLVSGELDIAYSSYVSLFQAIGKGLPLNVIRENNRPGPQGLFVAESSDIRDIEDLAGTQVAINSFGSIQELTTRAVLDDAGVDIDTLSFIEFPSAEMPAALSLGNVDVAWLVDPFATQAEDKGMRKIASAWQGPTADLPVAGWASSKKFVEANPNTVAAFNRVMTAAMKLAMNDPSIIAEIIPSYTEISPEVAEIVARNSVLAVESDLSGLSRVSELMEKYGFLEQSIDMEQVAITPEKLEMLAQEQ